MKSIPPIWLRAYLFMCCWFAFNLSISQWNNYVMDYEPGMLISIVIAIIFSCLYSIVVLFWSNFLASKPLTIRIIAHVTGLLATYAIYGLLTYFLTLGLNHITTQKFFDYLFEELSWLFIISNSHYISTVFVFYIIRYVQGIEEKEKEKSKLELANQQMQLSLLKFQLNPHFLFNTLNILSTLIYSEKEKAREVLNNFSDILRYSLDSDKEKLVPIKTELCFIDDYLFIQKMRFEDRLQIIKEISNDCLETPIPPMLLQPLIENAMIHGVAKMEEGGTINIRIEKSGNNVCIAVENSLPISKNKDVVNGVGLRNCDERLKVIYGNDSALKIDSTENEFKVSFQIPAGN